MDICDKLINLRIMLTTMCDGFSIGSGSKDIILSTRLKILCLLNDRDMSPAELIASLAVAKSNLANIFKIMIDEEVVESYKNIDNLRHVYYRITSKGVAELNKYKTLLMDIIRNQTNYDIVEVERHIDNLISAIKGNNYD